VNVRDKSNNVKQILSSKRGLKFYKPVHNDVRAYKVLVYYCIANMTFALRKPFNTIVEIIPGGPKK